MSSPQLLHKRIVHAPSELLALALPTGIQALSHHRSWVSVGGGVGLGVAGLLARATAQLPAILGGYYPDLDPARLAAMITAPLLGVDAGTLGAIALAQDACADTGLRFAGT